MVTRRATKWLKNENMFDTISFLIGVILGLLVMLFWMSLVVVEIPKKVKIDIKRDILGKIKPAQIIKKEDSIDEMLKS